MSKIHKKTCLILRVNDYQDNKSIIKAISKHEGMIDFSVAGFKKYNSRMHGKIHKLQLIDGIFYEKSNSQLSLSSIENNISANQIQSLLEYQYQQKLCFIAEKFSDIQTCTLIINIFAQTHTLGIHQTIHIYLIKILSEHNLIEIAPNTHQANYFYINNDGILNNQMGSHKISLSTFKIIKFIQQNNITQSSRIKPTNKILSELETLFSTLLEVKFKLSINYRNLNNIFDCV